MKSKRNFLNMQNDVLESKLQKLQVCFFEQELKDNFVDHQLQKAYKLKNHVKTLMQYRLNSQQGRHIHQRKGIQHEDVLKLMAMICGGYVQDDFSTYLSYNDFQQKKEEFDILKNIYTNAQKKYKSRKIEQEDIRFRSLLLMIFLEDNMNKMSRIKIEQIFSKNKMVW